MYKPRFNIGDIVIEKRDNNYSSSNYPFRSNYNIGKGSLKERLPYVGIVTSVKQEATRTEEGEEVYYIYTITGNDFVWYEYQLDLVRERGTTPLSSHTLEETVKDAVEKIDNLKKELENCQLEENTKIVVDLDIIFVKPFR